MLFNSLTFAIFLLVVFTGYWLLQGRLKVQNAWLLVAGCVFYGWWDWRFLGLLAVSTLTDFVVGRKVFDAPEKTGKKRWVALGMTVNLVILGFFKYFNFFIDSTGTLLGAMGFEAHLPTLRIVLPVGLSFYTFQSMSYTLDVYRGKFEPTRDLIGFLAFVSFFPQMVAGPIERAGHMLPQFLNPRRFDTQLARDGLRQILWGLFKKIVVADNLSTSVDTVFGNPAAHSGITLALGAFYFAMQIYCDFSGYSDMALGLGKLFGFELMRNFRTPYFSKTLPEFWQRWHISLSSWFRDYVFIPMGGSRVSPPRWAFNILVTFAVSGLWHGASWNFVIWGMAHGLAYLLDATLFSRMAEKLNWREASLFTRNALAFGRWLFCVVVVGLAWVFFRASTLQEALNYLSALFDGEWLVKPQLVGAFRYPLIVLVVEWLFRHRSHVLELPGWPRAARWAVYYGLIFYIFKYGSFQYVPFIYFQF
ncbi:MAG: MBOAT family O-acyltransferase [Prosthecobacter sp.]